MSNKDKRIYIEMYQTAHVEVMQRLAAYLLNKEGGWMFESEWGDT